jgi:transcriptional regulator with GAF, ATPase, and Fis domain
MTIEPEANFDALKRLLVDVAQERSVEALLRLIVVRLTDGPCVALARIWLLQPGDQCGQCSVRPECRDQSRCLHLVASAGQSLSEGREWTRLDGSARRIPLGVRKVGQIAARGEAIEAADLRREHSWLVAPEWAQQEGIQAFGGQPLMYKGQVLGVLAVFFRIPLGPDMLWWLRMIADHAAAAIANARAFEEIERLRARLEGENEYLRREVQAAHPFGDVIGNSPALRKVLSQVERVAPTDATVLILGESGAGKELIARGIHDHSPRRDGPMIKVNCASIPGELFESEFFGHVRGSFTGAIKDRVGRFELANSGTLFLDEVGEIPLEMQGKLLRVLQERTFERIGEEKTRRADVRLIAATNRDLRGEVEAGRFRQDLYYRLSVFPIAVAPLRERRDDIPLLAAQFLKQSCQRLGISERPLTRSHLDQLQAHHWPGNVRELQNVIERAAINSCFGPLVLDLPESVPCGNSNAAEAPDAGEPRAVLRYADIERLERDNLLAALERTAWKVSGPGGAAELLGIKPTTLVSRIKTMGIKRPK